MKFREQQYNQRGECEVIIKHKSHNKLGRPDFSNYFSYTPGTTGILWHFNRAYSNSLSNASYHEKLNFLSSVSEDVVRNGDYEQ
jgi:hypothetical protein